MTEKISKSNGFSKKQSYTAVRSLHAIMMTIFLSFLISGCVTPFKTILKQAGINKFVGQTVYNRVPFRSIKKNKIEPTNIYHQGVLIPAGSTCIIQDISKSSIIFILAGNKSKDNVYELTDWLIDPNDVDTRLSFFKFFVEDKDTVGLNNIRPEYYHGVFSGNEQIGMNKEEVLICLGYPAYTGRKAHANKHSRDYIIKQNDWIYLKGKFDKYILTFKDGILFRTDD